MTVNGAITTESIQELNDLHRMKIKCVRREEDLPVTEEEEEGEEEGLLALQQQLSPATMAEKWKRKAKNSDQ